MAPAEGDKLSDSDFELVSSAFEQYLAPALPAPDTHSLYFDQGTEALDRHYARYQQRVDAIVRQRGYKRGVNLISRNFPTTSITRSAGRRGSTSCRFLLRPVRQRRVR